MKTYEFFDHGKKICEFELNDRAEAEEKVIELSAALSYSIKAPVVTYKEIENGKTND